MNDLFKSLPSGVIIMDKPEGMSSFQVVAMLRRMTGVKKIGHSGTLDPFATGVLPLCVGKSTRLLRYLENDTKEYLCTVRFGSYSKTQDSEGELYGGRMPDEDELAEMRKSDYSSIRKLFEELPGILKQTPPAYSAVKIAGKKAYEYARKGIPVELKPRTVRIFDCHVTGIVAEPYLEVEFLISCSKGTYIRTICEDLGRKSEFGAYAVRLRRTRCGVFDIRDAHTAEEVARANEEGTLGMLFLDEEICVRHLPILELTENEAEHVRNGRQIPLTEFEGRMNVSDSPISDDEEKTDDPTDEKTTRYRAVIGNRLIAIVYPSSVGDNGVLRIERMLDAI